MAVEYIIDNTSTGTKMFLLNSNGVPFALTVDAAGTIQTAFSGTGASVSYVSVTGSTMTGQLNVTTVSGSAGIFSTSTSLTSSFSPVVGGQMFTGSTAVFSNITGTTLISGVTSNNQTLTNTTSMTSPLATITTLNATNITGTNVSGTTGVLSTLNAFTSITSPLSTITTMNATNVTGTNISGTTLVGSTLNAFTSITTPLITPTTVVATNITGTTISGTTSIIGATVSALNVLNLSGSSVVTNGNSSGTGSLLFINKTGNSLNFNTIAGAGTITIITGTTGLIVSGTAGASSITFPTSTTESGITIWSGTSGGGFRNTTITIDPSSNIAGVATLTGVTVNSQTLTNTTSMTSPLATITTINATNITGTNISGTTANIGTVNILTAITAGASGTKTIGTAALPFGTVTSDVVNATGMYVNGKKVLPQRTVSYTMDNGGTVLQSGVQGHLLLPFGCSVNQWSLLADISGSLSVDVRRVSYTNWIGTTGVTSTASIVTADKPTITAAHKGTNNTVTTWSGLAANDALIFHIDTTPTNITRANLTLFITPTGA